jgi:TolB-like protein
MGEVYRARDPTLEREVALKVLPAAMVADDTARARLLREAKMAARLNHPHVCTVHEVGEAEGQAYVAMELVPGQALSERLAGGRMGVEDVLRLGEQMADALAHAHDNGVVHRDFKSANVIVTPDGRAKVLDFGLAKPLVEAESEATTLTAASLTVPGAVVGTLAYMAPEQLKGRRADARSDVWALGVVLFEMASGVRPFAGKTGYELSSAILTHSTPPLPADVPPALAAIVERCLAKDPAQRYMRAGEVRSALETLRAGGAATESLGGRPAPRRRWVLLAGLAAVVAVVAALVVGGAGRRLLEQVGGPAVRAVAVLPVANLSGDPEQEYFSDGMTDALITDLSKIAALRVISRTSVMRYKGTNKRLSEIARELGVDAVLEASVLREANHLRLTARLLQPSSEQGLWAESYERDFSSVLSIQRDVARAVARTVRARMRPQEEERLARARQVNPATYEAYLRGMYLLNKATQADREKGLAHFQEAVANDPADPLAYAGLALAHTQLAHSSEARDDDLQRARAAAQTALKLDDSLAEVLLANGFVKGYFEWDWDEGTRLIRQALDINPSLAMAHYHLAWYLALFDRIPEAIEEHQRAKELDPFNPLHVAWLGELYRMNGQPREAEAECLKSIEMAPAFPPGHFVLGLVYTAQGRHQEAIAAIEKASEGSQYRWALGPAYAAAGRREEAVRLLDELTREKVTPWRAFWRAINHAQVGDLDEAFKWLEYEPHHIFVPWVRVLDWAAPLHRDPRFPAQLERMHLPPLREGGKRADDRAAD